MPTRPTSRSARTARTTTATASSTTRTTQGAARSSTPPRAATPRARTGSTTTATARSTSLPIRAAAPRWTRTRATSRRAPTGSTTTATERSISPSIQDARPRSMTASSTRRPPMPALPPLTGVAFQVSTRVARLRTEAECQAPCLRTSVVYRTPRRPRVARAASCLLAHPRMRSSRAACSLSSSCVGVGADRARSPVRWARRPQRRSVPPVIELFGSRRG